MTATRWIAAGPLRWRVWGEEHVAFNPVTGDTHLFDALTSSLLDELAEAPRSDAELAGHLAQVAGCAVDADIEAHVQRLIRELVIANLIRRIDP